MSKTPTAPKKPISRPRRVGLISLGCAKNLVDAEIALGVVLAIYESAKTRQPISTSDFIGDLSLSL